MAENTPIGLNRIERTLSFMVAAVAGLSILSIAAVFIARSSGMTAFTDGAWPVVAVLPLVGLPIAFVLLIVFMVMRIRRQRQAEQDGGK